MPKATFRLATIALASFMAVPMLAPYACPVPAGIELDETDTERMAQFEASRVRGLAEAMAATSQTEREVVAELFNPAIRTIETIPDGRYDCRTIKMGGISPLVVYDYFSCEISAGGTVIEKTSGSQRFSGTLTPTAQGLFFQGAGYYNDDPVRAYGGDAEFNQVGCLYRAGKADVYRLELPYPKFESTFDVIELVPTR